MSGEVESPQEDTRVALHAHRREQTVASKFLIVLGLGLVGLLAASGAIRYLERTTSAEILADARVKQLTLLDHSINLASRSLQNFADDLAATDALAQFVRAPDYAWAEKELVAALKTSNAQTLWILRADGTPVFTTTRRKTSSTPALPLEASALKTALTSLSPLHAFAEVDGVAVELCGAAIAPAKATREDAPLGWIVVALPWDDAQVITLASLTESEVQIVAPSSVGKEDSQSIDTLTLTHPLLDWRGHAVRTLLVHHRVPEFEVMRDTAVFETSTVLLFGLFLAVSLGLALNAWVLRPLRQVRESLARQDAKPLEAWRDDRTEFGQITALIESSLKQRESLRNEINERARAEEALRRSEVELRRTLAERARLGRDLHDGVIQSLYATGMGLKRIKQQLQPDQVEAAARLEQTRAALNEVIHDVRNFIIGLEPEALKLQTFSQAVAALLEFVQGQRPLRSTLVIDETVAVSLTLAQRVHALQIAREAVSNALRHGEASHVQITLAKEGEFVLFEVRDNGCGFDPEAKSGSGHGFSSFTQRARELGAELKITAAPGHGVQVRLTFVPFTHS